jgi:4-hydroxy-3-polyprenylbenzoate decarboxylase
VREPVSTVLEMTEIQTRLLATGGPACCSRTHPRDGQRSSIPCLVNLFGTVKRVAMGVTLQGRQRTTARDLREVGELLAFLRQPEPPRGFREAFDMLPLARTVMSMRPNVVKRAPVQDVVLTGADINLNALPIQSCWPGEPAPLITWPLIVTKGAEPSARGRLQPRHLPHAGAGQGPRDHALAGAPRRSPALRPS